MTSTDGIVLCPDGDPSGRLAIRRGEEAIAGRIADAALVVADLPGRRHCRFEVDEAGTATIRHLGHGSLDSPRVNDTFVGRERVVSPGDRISLVATTGRRLELVVEAGPPYVEPTLGPLAPPAPNVSRLARTVFSALRVLRYANDSPSPVSHRMQVHADGVVVVTCARESSDVPVAAARLGDATLRALSRIADPDAIARLDKRVGEGRSVLVVSASNDARYAMTSFAFDDSPSDDRIAIPLMELTQLVIDGLPSERFASWTKALLSG